jgi:hypothetical protein
MSQTEPAANAGPTYAPPTTRRTNRMAIWSLILSILTLGGLGSIAGIVLGTAARRRIAVTGEGGSGLAMAGVIVGVITLLLAIAYWVFIAVHTGGSGGGGGGYGY